MAKKGRAVNRRKPSTGGGKPLIALLIVALLIAAAFFLLEHFRRPTPPATVETRVDQVPHMQIPPRTAPPQQRAISSASLRAALPAAPAKPRETVAPRQKGAAQVAIIIDDMGSSMQELQELLDIKLPLTFSVIPSLAHARGVAESAHRAGAEVMVHMPMEPEGYPKQKMEKIGLLIAMGNDEIGERVNGYFASVPFAAGANNHMGSRFTRDGEKMAVVLKVLKGRGVFFVDSRTSPASVGYEQARALGLKCGSRQVFLDNVQDEAAIGKQLAELVAIAKKKGGAIAICHPHPATIRTLKAMLPELAKGGITFVHASALTS